MLGRVRFFLRKIKVDQNLRLASYAVDYTHNEPEISEEVEVRRQVDMPIEAEDPFEEPKPQCVLCKYKVKIDYKNVRLLSQFVSSFTGRVYGRHVSGLCERQQKLVETAIMKARSCGLMPYYFKDPSYAKDPLLFDPERPIRSHKY